MKSPYYTSGFLYSLKTQQILLLQPNLEEGQDSWSLLGGESIGEEEAQIAFQRIVSDLLKIDLKTKDIYPIYDYFHSSKNKTHFVFYAEVKNTKNLKNSSNDSLAWLTFSETVKLPFASQTKQDIVVGERVINAKWRDDEAKRNSITTAKDI